MSSYSKSFKAHPFTSASTRKSTFLIFSYIFFGLVGFLFGISTFVLVNCDHYRCVITNQPKSVNVVWDTSNNMIVDADKIHNRDTYDKKRHKVMGFVGIQTGFGSMGRRRSLRATWMPSNHHGLQRLEEATGLAFRFVIGRTSDKSKMEELRREVAEYDDFLLLDIEEGYSKLSNKTLAFFKAAYALYDSEFYVKADDDIYLRPDRLSLLLAKERHHSRTYLGCMKKGPVYSDPKNKWFEPLSNLLGKEYFLYANGPIYALSVDVVASLVAVRDNSFRLFSNEDVTIGAWMLAMDVTHENNGALCQQECTPNFVAVMDNTSKCSGLCNPETKLVELHQKENCKNEPPNFGI